MQVLTAGDNEELCYCLKAWQALPQSVQFGSGADRVDALKATAVVDRVRRALGSLSTSALRILVRALDRLVRHNSHSFDCKVVCLMSFAGSAEQVDALKATAVVDRVRRTLGSLS